MDVAETVEERDCKGPQAQFVFNMSDAGLNHNYDTLLLPAIDWMQYSVAFTEEVHTDTTHHAVLSQAGDVVTVMFDVPVLATVYVEVRCCTGGMQRQSRGQISAYNPLMS